MKSIQYLMCLWFAGFGQIMAQNAKVTFNIQVDSKEISEVTLSKYQYENEKLGELKTIPIISVQEKYPFEDPFFEPFIYGISTNNGKEIRIAVESPGEIILTLGDEIDMESKVGVKSDFARTIQELNAHYFGELIHEYDVALSENDQHTIAKLEERKTASLVDFVHAMEDRVRQMGASALAYDALAYFDLHKNYDFLVEMVERFQSEYPGSNMTRSLQKRMKNAALVALGSEAPLFTATEQGGSRVDLTAFEGSYVMIDFWASWCRACRVENPKFLEVYNTYDGKGFEIISVSIDEDSDQWKKAIEKDAISWTQILDANHSIYNQYLLSSLPSNFLLDQEGIIIAKNIDSVELSNLMEELLGE